MFFYSLPVLSDPLGIITSAYFFVCKIGIIVRWIYICELIATKFPCQKYNVTMDEVPTLYLPSRPTVLLNHIAQGPVARSMVSVNQRLIP